MTQPSHMVRSKALSDAAATRILMMDGAMGTMLQQAGLVDADFHGEAYADHPHDLAGCNDVLCVTRPDVVEA